MSAISNLKANELTGDLVRQIVDYDKNTGVFTWKRRPFEHFKTKRAFATYNSRFAGRPAGTKHICKKNDTNTYLRIKIGDRPRPAHRLVFLWMYNRWPEEQVDHINRNGLDNRLCNLREVTPRENMRNKRLYKNNSTGECGVTVFQGSYVASIAVGGKNIYLGSFQDIRLAKAARDKAISENGYHKNHGREL